MPNKYAKMPPVKIPKDLRPVDSLRCNRGYILPFQYYSEGKAVTTPARDRRSTWEPNGRNILRPDTRWIVEVIRAKKVEDPDAKWLRWLSKRQPVIMGPAQIRKLRKIANRLDNLK